MNYPQEILPNPNYKFIDCNLSQHFLIRFTNTNDVANILDSVTKNVKVEHICSPKERIEDLSMSLFGIYNEHHITLDFTPSGKEKFMHYCLPDATVETPLFETDFLIDNNRHFWCILIEKINNRDFDYTRSNNPFVAKCLVLHTPMRWNYWHFSLRWTTDLGALENLEENQRKSVAKRIAHSARALIAQMASIIKPNHTAIDENCYLKNPPTQTTYSRAFISHIFIVTIHVLTFSPLLNESAFIKYSSFLNSIHNSKNSFLLITWVKFAHVFLNSSFDFTFIKSLIFVVCK